MTTETSTTNKGLVLGDWHYWPDSGQLKQGAIQQNLPTQLNDVLQLLVTKAPGVVTREQFLQKVWSGKIVNEDALSRTIAELRKVLGDSASQAKYIKTIPKRGYQLTVNPISLKQKRMTITSVLLSLFVSAVLLVMLISFVFTESTTQRLINAVANAQRITSKPGMEQQSHLSEDGQWLTFTTNTSQDSIITLQSLTNPNQSHEVSLPGYRLASPLYDSNTQTIWFVAQDESQCQLMSMEIHNKSTKTWSDCVFESESRVMVAEFNNKRLYFSNKKESKVGIYLLDISSGQIKPITNPNLVNDQDWSPNISPDGSKLSFSRGNQTVRNIWLKDLQNGKELSLTTGEHYSVSHDWMDERFIVLDSDKTGSRQLWLLDTLEKKMQPIGGYGAQHPVFNDAGTTMTFQKVAYEANIWQINLNNQKVTRLVHSTKYDNNPAFAPDGDSFAYSSNRQDIGSIWLYDYKQSQESLLLSIPDTKLTRPNWTADGTKLLITANDEDGFWTLSYDLNSQVYEKLPFSLRTMAAGDFMGQLFALAQSDTLSNQIVQLDESGGKPLPIPDVSRFMFVADGRLVYSKTNQTGLFINDITGLNEKILIHDFPINAFNLWTVVNQSVYYDWSAGPAAGLYRYDVETGIRNRVSDFRPYSVGTSLSVNTAEDAILVTRTDRAESDVFKATIEL